MPRVAKQVPQIDGALVCIRRASVALRYRGAACTDFPWEALRATSHIVRSTIQGRGRCTSSCPKVSRRALYCHTMPFLQCVNALSLCASPNGSKRCWGYTYLGVRAAEVEQAPPPLLRGLWRDLLGCLRGQRHLRVLAGFSERHVRRHWGGIMAGPRCPGEPEMP